MARKHDLKARKIQLESLENKDEGEDVVILVKTKLRGSESFDTNTNALDYVMRKDIENVADLIPIAPWVNTEAVKLNQYRSHQIGAYEYLFRNLLNLNTNEPTLDGDALAWTYLGVDGPPLEWNSGTTYQPFDVDPLFVYRDLGGGINRIYKSVDVGNLNNIPESSPDFWEDIGEWKTPYNPLTTYDLGDFVLDNDPPFKNYISNTDGNNYLFHETIPGTKTWQLIGIPAGGEPPTILSEDDLTEESYGDVWYCEIDVPEGLTVGCIDYKIGTETNRLSIDNAVTNTANTPNTKISGFPEIAKTSSTTITIKLI